MNVAAERIWLPLGPEPPDRVATEEPTRAMGMEHAPPGPRSARPRAPARIVLLAAALLPLACGGPAGTAEDLPVLWDAPDFALTDQEGDTLRSEDLRGQAWVVHPFFINCRDVCPATTSRMAAVRDSLAADGSLGVGARLVSITVDPARDSTAALRRWAEENGGSPPDRWAFLGGSAPGEVRRLVQEGFRLAAMMPDDSAAGGAAGEYQVVHASRVVLVDGEGRIRGTYEILRPADFSGLVEDVRRLIPTGR